MSPSKLQRVATDLVTALEAESDALRDGDFAGAQAALAEKMSRFEAFESESGLLDEDVEGIRANPEMQIVLKRLLRARERNERLVDAARQGLMQAQARVVSVAKRSAEVGVYGADGDRVRFDDPLVKGRGRTA